VKNWLAIIALFSSTVFAQDASTLIQEIQSFESEKDPKCYATASRLEDFMFGTPLAPDARFEKNQLSQHFVLKIWQKVAKTTKKPTINAEDLLPELNALYGVNTTAQGHYKLTFRAGLSLIIHKDDLRQYASIAYSLRSILAAQQTMMFEGDLNTALLTKDAISLLKKRLDLLSLATLKIADLEARKNNQQHILKAQISTLWQELANLKNTQFQLTRNTDKTLLKQVIEQKVAAYQAYNKVSSQIFVRNLQVFYARQSWPKDPQQATFFRQYFTEALIQFATTLYQGANQTALNEKHALIQESDVYEFSQRFIPHKVNEYEDVAFFPKLAYGQQVYLEAYDMDSFRDSGIHWRYLQFALDNPELKSALTADPFAAELITENIAIYGVLLLRVAGNLSKEKASNNRLAPSDLVDAVNNINDKIGMNSRSNLVENIASIYSSNHSNASSGTDSFKDVSTVLGVKFEHRSSDWLNRLLRSYLKKEAGVGEISIPPAFGGAGIAAEDIDNDGDADLLLLSGTGNKLFENRNGRFIDITHQAGLVTDGLPGEPRQPLIADLDNDGDQDIIITFANQPHHIYENLGGTVFKKREGSPIGGIDMVGGPATVFDANNDGLLDIYLTYFGNYPKGILPSLARRNINGLPNKLWINQGNLTFKEKKASGLDNIGWGQAVTHTDLNDDGFQDVIVGNDFGVNGYYLNNGDAVFTENSEQFGTNKPSYTMGIGIADINQDQKPDIYISNIVTMNKDESYVLPSKTTDMKFDPNKLSQMRVVEANDLFISSEQKYVNSKLVGRGYNSTGWSWGADFFDYDNDTDMDLYVTNGMNEFNLYSSDNPEFVDQYGQQKNIYIPVAEKETNVFFENNNGKLNNKTSGSGLDYLGNSRAATYLDWNLDGKLDVALSNYHGAVHLYENQTKNDNHWLAVKLTGSPKAGSNLDAIGARIVITLDNGETLWREVHGSVAYMTVHPKQQNFGLGRFTKANMQIRWPNGELQSVNVTKVDTVINITQGDPS